MHMLFAFACLLAVFSTASAQATPGLTVVTGVVTNVTAGTYPLGTVIGITVTFNDTVNVDLSASTADFQIVLNTLVENAVYVSGSGSRNLLFALTVVDNDQASRLSYQTILAPNPFRLNGANVTDSLGLLTQISDLSFNPNVVATDPFINLAVGIDGIAPTLISLAFAAGNYTLNQRVPLYLHFSEAVTVKGEVHIEFLGLDFVFLGINATDNTTLNFGATVTEDIGNLSPSLATVIGTIAGLGLTITSDAENSITDLAGNALVTSGSFVTDLATGIATSITFARANGGLLINSLLGETAIVGIFSDQSDVTLTVGDTINIYVEFDRRVTLALPVSASAAASVSLSLNNGGVATLTSGVTLSTLLRFTYTVEPTDGDAIEPNYLDVSGSNALSLGSLVGVSIVDSVGGTINLATPFGTSTDGEPPAGQNTTLARNNIQVQSSGDVIIFITSRNATGIANLYAEGDDLWINVTFASAVTVTGKPTLDLNNGREATYSSVHSTSESPIFVYTVTADDSADSQLAIADRNPFHLNGGKIIDAFDNAANLTIPAGISLNLGYFAEGSSNVIARIIIEFYDINSCGSQALQDDEDAIAQIVYDHFNFTFLPYQETSCNSLNKRQNYVSDVTLEFDITDFNGNEGSFGDNQDDVINAINNLNGVQLISIDFSASPVLMPTLFGIALLFLSLLMRN